MAKATSAPSENLIISPPTQLSKRNDLPEYIQIGDQAGMEEMTSNDVVLPRFGLCQAQTPERKKNDPKYIEGLEEGDFFNTVTHRIYGPVLRIIPVRFWRSRIQFFPIDDGGGIDCQSLNGVDGGHYSPTCGSCKHKDFANGSKPVCMEFHNRVSMQLPEGDVGVVSMKSSALGVSRQWGMIAKMRNAALFSAIYEIKSVAAMKGGNNYYTYTSRLVQNVSQDDFKQARALYESVSGKTLIVEQEVSEAEVGDPSFDGPSQM